MTKDKNILIHNIYYMLAYAFRYFRFNMIDEIKGEKFENMQDLFAEILIRSVSSQIKQGLYRTYVSQEEALPVIRGKIDLLKTHEVQRCKPLHAYCLYDELSFNNPYNQIIKATLQNLLRCSNVDANRKNSIRHILRYFTAIDSMSLVSVQWNRFVFDSNNQNYQFLINICRFIYEEKLMTTENGVYKLKSLSDDQMERLFEKFVLEYYKKHHPETKPLGGKQIRWKTKTTSNILPVMKTDIILTIGKRTLILDTKYSSKSMNDYYNKEKIHRDHSNQIFTYVINYDIGHTGTVDGMLLYAKTLEDVVPDGKDTFTDGNVFYYKNLDLNQDFRNIRLQLDNIVDNIRNHGDY